MIAQVSLRQQLCTPARERLLFTRQPPARVEASRGADRAQLARFAARLGIIPARGMTPRSPASSGSETPCPIGAVVRWRKVYAGTSSAAGRRSWATGRRGALLGEVVAPDGARFDIQLKGCGHGAL